MYQVGDFFEMFGEDAKQAARLLKLTEPDGQTVNYETTSLVSFPVQSDANVEVLRSAHDLRGGNVMRSKGAQVSLFDTYKDVADSYENNKPRLFRLLDELIDWDALIPQRFFCAFYQTMGRPRVYGLVSFLKMLILQRIFGYIADSQLLVTLRHSREMRDFCELKKVPDAAKLTRFNNMIYPWVHRNIDSPAGCFPGNGKLTRWAFFVSCERFNLPSEKRYANIGQLLIQFVSNT